MVVNNTIQKLMELGFSEYESRSYIALLEENPATAYEIAKRAAVPTSKIYQVIARLVDKGVVLPLRDENRKRYAPLPAEEFIQRRRHKLARTMDGLQTDLSGIESNRDVSFIWNFKEYAGFMDKAEQIIRETHRSLLLSVWDQELRLLEGELLRLKQRDIPMAVVHFGEQTTQLDPVFRHPIQDTLYAERGGRGFTLVSDQNEAMMATIPQDNHVEGAWSRNRGFVTLAEDYIKHDIYIMKIVARYEGELIRRFGENYVHLRDVFSDKEEDGV